MLLETFQIFLID